jgi:tRNA nucleotidyltransferase (CCA-adding enzyme)
MQIHGSTPCTVYLVGGAVRDSLMDIVPHDYDYIVVAPTLMEVKHVVQSLGAAILHEDARYGLVRARIDNASFDFVMARCDGVYTDHRHCDSIRPGTLAEDLSRRDFTVNAIAIDSSSQAVIDPYNGVDDLANRKLKCVGNAEERLSEDPLRILRAIRFIVTHGLTPDDELQQCLQSSTMAQKISFVSADRMRQELDRCMQNNVHSCLSVLLGYPHLLSAVLEKVTLKWRKK